MWGLKLRLWVKVKRLWFGIKGSGFKIAGIELEGHGLGCMTRISRSMVRDLGSRVSLNANP
jgi:hypothetical protein